MNCEYAIDSVLENLESGLSVALETIRIESGSSYVSPLPQNYDFGEKVPSAVDNFPAIMVKAVNTDNKDNQYKTQERIAFLEVIFWIVNVDENDLHRIVVRYGEAITRILREETNWRVNLYNPKVSTCQYSDIYDVNFGLAQAGSVKVEIDYLIT